MFFFKFKIEFLRDTLVQQNGGLNCTFHINIALKPHIYDRPILTE